MATTTRQPADRAGPRWLILLRPRWVAWHAFAVVGTIGMLYLGNWQLHRAESGNQLSWAYTFEWPLFAVFGVYFWFKTMRDELREHGVALTAEGTPGAGAAAAPPEATIAGVTSTVETNPAAQGSRRAASWDATSWDATSWDAASWEATGPDARTPDVASSAANPAGAGRPVDISRATPADGEAYVARLMAEVQRAGRKRPRR